MLQLRKSNSRGGADFGWLKTFHSFSFGDYYDPNNMGFGDLRVINEDYIAPATGFPLHGHRDMEIITYLVDGAIQHTDSMGNVGVIKAGEIQWMSAGKGVRHSEENPSPNEVTKLLQIWIEPNRSGLAPDYAQANFLDKVKSGRLTLLVSADGENDSMRIRQDAKIYAQKSSEKIEEEFHVPADRRSWIQVIDGPLIVNGISMQAGDALAIKGEEKLNISADQGVHYLLFDLRL